MKVAILGSGGREHALVWKLSQTIPEDDIFTLPGNGGTPNNVSINPIDFGAIGRFCDEKDIKLLIVGPELPLDRGIVDFFLNSGVRVFGPSQEAAQLETSKVFAKRFMERHGVATARYRFIDYGEPSKRIRDSLKAMEEFGGEGVIKFDGLAAGKGVFVCRSNEEAEEAVSLILKTYGKEAPFLVEETLQGDEISIIGITDGKHIHLLSPSQDHKQLLDGDKGPNTGGMGAFCPVSFCGEDLMWQIETEIVQPTLAGIHAENFNYKGFLYFGLMITPQGPKVLEYNARLGDPETEVILPALKSDFLQFINSCFKGTLERAKLSRNEGFFADVVLASGGYPGNYEKGLEITGLEAAKATGALIFHAGTKKQDDKILTNGGRVLNVVGHGKTLNDALEMAYAAAEKIDFKGKYYRTDIGKRTLKHKI